MSKSPVELKQILKELGFESIESFRAYMRGKAKPMGGGFFNHNEKRQGYELNYSSNCKSVFGVGANVKGSFRDYRFN